METVRRFKVGDVVRCEREAPAKGTWKKYAGRVGTVVVANSYGEVGVSFDRNDPIGNRRSADGWFLPSELVVHASAATPGKPKSAPRTGQTGFSGPQPEIGSQLTQEEGRSPWEQ